MNGTDRLTRTARDTVDSPAIFVSSAPHSTLFLGFDLCAREGFDVQLNKVSHLLTTSCVNYHHLLSCFCAVLRMETRASCLHWCAGALSPSHRSMAS